MRKSKTAIIGIFLCVTLIAFKIINIIRSWGSISPSDGKPLQAVLSLTYYAPAIIFLILRIVVFAKSKIRVLLPIICVLEIIFELRPTIQLISVNGISGVHIPSCIAQLLISVVPSIMILIMAANVERKSPRLFYLPAAIYFVLSITKMATDYLNPSTVNFNLLYYTPIIIWTALYFIVGLFIKEN
jgi:hypothetical protein